MVTAQISIGETLDCAVAKQTARRLTCELGFAAAHSEEVVLAVAELASNVVRHAGHGTLIFRPLNGGERVGIEVEAEDHGPGMKDIEQAFADGYSSAGGLGYGLGTVNRLMDELEITSTAALGTRILCRRWIRRSTEAMHVHAWEVGVASRPRGCARENGDAFVVREWDGKLLAGVIDGLGHGEPAQQAALAAQTFVQSHYELALEKMLLGAGRACRGTRGVVMALARFDSLTDMTFSSLGNVEVRAWSGEERLQFLVKRGILGVGEPHTIVQHHRWNPGWTLVLHSDGLHAHWQWGDFPGLEWQPAQAIADKLLHELAKDDDDATAVVVKS
jgi:anti-sigma regulatory factor (Ser/Thr protein kinase)/serine/threonine protein phosphatase PrpC